MKTGCFRNHLAAAAFALTSLVVTGGEDLARWVDPFVGTSATGHTFPAACVPFGLVQAGADTGNGNWDYCSGYRHGDGTILGFSHTHLNGTGCPDLGDVLILPFRSTGLTGLVNSRNPVNLVNPVKKLSEVAEPGYYATTIDGGIKVEIAAAEHSAIYRITGNGRLRLLVDCAYGIGGRDFAKTITASDVKLIGKSGLSGKNHRRQWVERDYSFVVKFGREFASVEELTKREGVVAPQYVFDFDLDAVAQKHNPSGRLLVKVALSAEGGVEAAERNLAAEIADWDFDAVKSAARAKWNEVLSRATIEGTVDQKKNWYTSLYHLFIQPNNIADAGAKPFYSTFSCWDTFRAAHPLYTILVPEKAGEFVDSILEQGKRTGFLPIWCLWGKDNQCMIGTHSVPVIVDWFLKECKVESVKCKVEGGELFTNDNCHNCSQISNTNISASLRLCVKNRADYWISAYAQIRETLTKRHANRRKERWDLLDKYGYYPFDEINGESVSRTVECAYDDWCAGVMAAKLGELGTGDRERDESLKADAKFFFRRSESWRNVFDASIGLVRGKDSSGRWREPYDPYTLGHGADKANDFTEGNAFQYTWHVMQNPMGLVDAMGGRDAFVKKLDSLFEAPSKTEGMGEVLDVTGLIGQYVHGNEPSHHVIYFYPQVGHPEKAAERIREVFDKFYLPKPDGLCGNDDCGQMSAWYVFSAMGFYPFNPCGGEYVIGAPQVPKVTIELESIVGVGERMGKIHSPTRTQNSNYFTIIARNLSKENKYVKSVTLNGKPITDWKIRHSDIMSGGELAFEMCAAISLVAPVDGAEVPLLRDRQRAFMRMPRERRAAYFNDKRPDMKKAIKTLRSAPRPVKLEWTGRGGPYKVTVSKRGADEPWFCETVASNSVDVWNLEIAATYDWTVCAGGECAKGWFRTEDQAPRLVCVPGVPNMRDIGGRVIGGRRVRQGLVYRSSGLNNNATTNAPGTARLTERWRNYMRDRLGIKTDLDLRSTRERFGMTCSPLGPDVKLVTMPTNYHAYAAIHTTGADDTRRVLRVFLDRANYPIDFHCIGGADRTGTVATILHGILGLDEDEIWKDYQITAWHGVVNDTHHLKRFKSLVDSFDRFEGATLSDRIRKYVLWLGFTESDMQTIRDIMFEGPSREPGARGVH